MRWRYRYRYRAEIGGEEVEIIIRASSRGAASEKASRVGVALGLLLVRV